MSKKCQRKTYTQEFKQQMVDLFNAGKPRTDIILSRRKIQNIMKIRGLKSTYTKPAYRNYVSNVNNSVIKNKLDRNFSNHEPLEAIVTDLTYVRVGTKWAYVCFIINLFNREIIGHSCGLHKDAGFVKRAFQSISYPLTEIQLLHTDRGKEFDNQTMDTILKTFNIERSLSKKGCPYDNAVAESTYKSFKVEFVHPNKFQNLDELRLQLFDDVNWWNHLRLHGSLNYETPVGVRNLKLAERTLDDEPGCGNVA